tara:strand:- start:120 stop:629 length:510 start_codon:yes stop_codon:yes gene_type:complete
MAKSDSFFIRAGLTGLTAGAYTTTSIDLGPYVDALAKTVLRVHNISVQYNFGNGAPELVVANGEGHAQWQLTTQDQAALVLATDRSVVSTGQATAANGSAVANTFTFFTDRTDIAPQEWENGYLIAVESLQLAGLATGFVQDVDISIVMECTSETMSQSAAMALALSQQ